MKKALWLLATTICFAIGAPAQNTPVRGLWVYRTPTLLDLASRGEALRDFCRSHRINEVYLAYSSENGGTAEEREIQKLIGELHKSHVSVEALLTSMDADEPGKHRDQLMEHVSEVVSYNRGHEHERFDGIHLDVDPQQRQEYKTSGKLTFLPNLLDTYRAVRALAEQNHMTVDADIPLEFVEADLQQRQALLSALPRFTLLLYQLSGPAGVSRTEELRRVSQKSLQTMYQGTSETHVARLSVGLRTPDYGHQITAMLQVVQQTLSGNPHYLGWAWHCYNDVAQF